MFKTRKNLVSISSLGDKKQLSERKKSRSSCPEVFCQQGFLKKSQNSPENTCTGFFFIRVTGLSCFHVNSAKFLRTPILQTKSKRLLYKTMFIIFPEFQSYDLNNFCP